MEGRMTFLLDTNACIQVMRNPRGAVATRFFATPAVEMAISIITKAELLIGPYRKASPPAEHAKVKQILAKLHVVPFDEKCADEFARIAAHLLDVGKPSGDLDVQIAAAARALDLTIVTHNTRHFANIPGIRLEDWQF
jgi:tRNA(fMet)-specific endonuclease VapC